MSTFSLKSSFVLNLTSIPLIQVDPSTIDETRWPSVYGSSEFYTLNGEVSSEDLVGIPLDDYRPCIPMNNPLSSWRVWISFWNIVHPNKKIYISRISLIRHREDEISGFKYEPSNVMDRDGDRESGAQLLVPSSVSLQEVKEWIVFYFGKNSIIKPNVLNRPDADLVLETTTERLGFYVPWNHVTIPLDTSVFNLVPNLDKNRFSNRKYNNSSDTALTTLGWMSLAETCRGWVVPLGTEGLLFQNEEDYALIKVVS